MIESNKKLEEDLNKKKKYHEKETTSRLIVFNIPTYFTESKLSEHFSSKGTITDCKIKRKGDKSRKFAFVGFKNEAEAKSAKDYFNNSYIDTGKIDFLHKTYFILAQIKVEFAKTQEDPNLPRGWSKYKKGTMAYDRLHPEEYVQKKKPTSQIEAEERKDIEQKKKKFKEFVKVMLAKTQKSKSQSWNESFNDFMPSDATKSRREKKKEERELKEKQKQEKEDTNLEENIMEKKSEVRKVTKNVTVVEKEIHKRSAKLGKNISKQIHVKFDENADIDEAIHEIEDIGDKNVKNQTEQKREDLEDEEIDENRLYVVNLPFSITETELREYFGKYGEIEEVSLPLKKGGVRTGFAFIRFVEPESAVNAYANLDKKIYQGRILSITPASRK